MSERPLTVPSFRFSGIASGIKVGGVPDLALVVSDVPAVTVGVFTTNQVQAAPVLVSKKNIRWGLSRAIVINSGNANACTGARGIRDARAMVRATARALHVLEREVLVCSTGKIGIPLPIERVLSKIPDAVKRLSPNGLLKSARAILTTDDSVKVASFKGRLGRRDFTLVGFAKGAGMIEPHMATMLAFLMTDLRVDRKTAQLLFNRSVDQTFNRITVDGDVSTNDTAILMANGVAGNQSISPDSSEGRVFGKALIDIMSRLATMMVADGEGGTKVVRIFVHGASNDATAKKIAYTVANSPLVKTSFFGEDPNWGRLLAAAGRSGAPIKPDRADIFYEGICVARGGVSTGSRQNREAKKVMRRKGFTITLDFHMGRGRHEVMASDLSLDYVKLNSCYRT